MYRNLYRQFWVSSPESRIPIAKEKNSNLLRKQNAMTDGKNHHLFFNGKEKILRIWVTRVQSIPAFDRHLPISDSSRGRVLVTYGAIAPRKNRLLVTMQYLAPARVVPFSF